MLTEHADLRKVICALFVFASAFFFVLTGVSISAEIEGRVIIFHAGSLSVPFARMERAFEGMHRGIDVQREAAGSRACARKISELGKPCDIMASADYTVIDELLVPRHARWSILFATNRMVLCYTGRSRFADEIGPDNWMEILSRKGVIWGHADPDADPCGYRSLMVLQLAELYYKRPGLARRLIENRPLANIRPKSVELISLLETGHMDYAWEYLSVAVQHGLRYIALPREIDLSSPELEDFYRHARVKVSGREPGTVITKTGRAIVYGVTLLEDAPNRAAAIEFLKFLLSPQGGLAILRECGQPPLSPPVVEKEEMWRSLPDEIRGLVGTGKERK